MFNIALADLLAKLNRGRGDDVEARTRNTYRFAARRALRNEDLLDQDRALLTAVRRGERGAMEAISPDAAGNIQSQSAFLLLRANAGQGRKAEDRRRERRRIKRGEHTPLDVWYYVVGELGKRDVRLLDPEPAVGDDGAKDQRLCRYCAHVSRGSLASADGVADVADAIAGLDRAGFAATLLPDIWRKFPDAARQMSLPEPAAQQADGAGARTRRSRPNPSHQAIADHVREKVLEYDREHEGLSLREMERALKAEGLEVDHTTIGRILKRAGRRRGTPHRAARGKNEREAVAPADDLSDVDAYVTPDPEDEPDEQA